MTDMLSVTGRHLDHVSAELDLLTSPILPATFAFIASREGDLVARSPWVGRSPENMACQEQQRRIVVERSAGVTAKLCHCLPKRRERTLVSSGLGSLKSIVYCFRLSVSRISSSFPGVT